MPAYAIFIRESVTDQAELDQYNAMVPASATGHSFTPLAAYGAHEAWEGDASQGVVILRFDDMDAARAWYQSPAYQAAKEHRLKGAVYRVLLTDGLG